MKGKVAAIVLAAGTSQRMGRDKLLLPYRGKPLLCAALDAALGSGADPVVCVVGDEAREVQAALAPEQWAKSIRWVINPSPGAGRSSSIRAGLEAVPEACEAALFLPGDVPGASASEVESLLTRYLETRAPVVVAVERDHTPSHPVLFARSLFPKLLALQGDTGARGILLDLWDSAEKVVRSGPPLLDVNTPEDYHRLLEQVS